MHFHYNDLLSHAPTEYKTNNQFQDGKREIKTNNQQLQDAKAEIVYLRNQEPYNHEIYNLSRPFLDQYCFILHLSDPCPSVDKKRRNIACSLYDHAQAQ